MGLGGEGFEPDLLGCKPVALPLSEPPEDTQRKQLQSIFACFKIIIVTGISSGVLNARQRQSDRGDIADHKDSTEYGDSD
jgi:hypothetical protein